MVDQPSPSQALQPIHATAVNLAVNNSDFVLVFVQITPILGQEGLTSQIAVVPVATVSMSPATAKQLRRQLDLAIGGFEESTGVTIPDLGSIKESSSEISQPT